MPNSASYAQLADTPDTPEPPHVPVRVRHDGWTVDRQRRFLTALAESGSVTQAAASVGLSASSAYRLRVRPDGKAFGVAWDEALRLAAGRLVALAFERAVTGRVRQMWKDGELVGSVREPSDRLLMFLLTSFNLKEFGGSPAQQREYLGNASRGAMPRHLDALTDSDCDVEPIQSDDFAGASMLPPQDNDDEPFDLE